MFSKPESWSEQWRKIRKCFKNTLSLAVFKSRRPQVKQKIKVPNVALRAGVRNVSDFRNFVLSLHRIHLKRRFDFCWKKQLWARVSSKRRGNSKITNNVLKKRYWRVTVLNLETFRLSIVEINSSNWAKDHTFRNSRERLRATLLQLPIPQNRSLTADYDIVTRQTCLDISARAYTCRKLTSWSADLLHRRQRLKAASRASQGSWKYPIIFTFFVNFSREFFNAVFIRSPSFQRDEKPKSVILVKSALH